MGTARSPEEIEVLRVRAAELRAAGVGSRRIAKQLGIGGSLAAELLRDVPLPSSLARPRAKDDLREAALLLRQQGRTYDEIRDELAVSKGSLSLWLRDLEHPSEAQRAAMFGSADEQTSGGASEAEEAEWLSDRELARDLRREGRLLREIAVALGAAPKTALLWCSGVAVPPRAVHGRDPELVRAMGRAYWDRTLAERDVERKAVASSARSRVGLLTDRELELVAVTAYWCEGSKSKPWRRQERVVIINSDRSVIEVWLEFLRRRGIGPERLSLALSIHESADVAAATAYWSEVTGIPTSAFGRAMLKRHNPKTVRKNVSETYQGCLVVRVLQGRLLYQEIAGLWDGIVGGAGLRHDIL